MGGKIPVRSCLLPHRQQEFHRRRVLLEPYTFSTSAAHFTRPVDFLTDTFISLVAVRALARSHIPSTVDPKQQSQQSLEARTEPEPPLLLVKQGCGQSRTRLSLRFSHSRRDANGNVDSISIIQAGPYGSPDAVIKSAAQRVNRVHKLLCILRCFQLICSESNKHSLIQCLDSEQPRTSPRKERSQLRHHGLGWAGKQGKCRVDI